MPTITREAVLALHRRLPEAIWESLEDLGIPRSLVHAHLLGWDGTSITVPIRGRDRSIRGLEYLEVGDDGELRAVMEHSLQPALLFGEHMLSWGVREVVIVEGVGEALVATAHGVNAFSATGDGLWFRDEWASWFGRISEVVICFKRTDESTRAALVLADRIPRSRIVVLPPEVGQGGVREFFALGKTATEFRMLVKRGLTEDV